MTTSNKTTKKTGTTADWDKYFTCVGKIKVTYKNVLKTK